LRSAPRPARLPKKSQNLNLSFWRIPCPPIAPRTVPLHLCRRPPLPTLECGGHAAAFEAKAPAIHARKEAHRNNSLCSLCSAFCALCGKSFSSLTGPHWPGQVKPKTASTLAYLGQTLVQTLPLAQHEYINAYGTNSWRETIRTSHEQSANHTSPDPESPTPEPEPAPAPTPAAPSAEP